MKTISCWIICLFGFLVLHKLVIGSKPKCIQFNKLDEDWVEFKTSKHPITKSRIYYDFKELEEYDGYYFICKNIENSDDVNLAKQGLRELRAVKGRNYGVIFLGCNVDVLPNDFLLSIKLVVNTVCCVGCKMKKVVFDLINPPRFGLIGLMIFYSLIESRAISTGEFQQNHQLTSIYIGHTNIERVERNAFLSLTELKYLSIPNNKIQSLDADVFQYLNKLQYLYIDDNNLKDLSIGIFDPLKDLIQLSLTGNNFHCDCKLQRLQNWLHDKKANTKGFSNDLITCSTPKEGNLETLTFCTMCDIVPESIKKDHPRDCPLKEFVALNILRKNNDKSMDGLIQEYLGKLDMEYLCDPESCPFKQPLMSEDSNNYYYKHDCMQK